MERLTKNDYGEYWLEARKEPRAIKKLGILEDIEQEIGIPLEVLFKALKNKKTPPKAEKKVKSLKSAKPTARGKR